MTSKTTVSILAIAAVIGVSGLLYSLRDPVIPDSSNDANQRVAGSEMEAAQDVATTEALSEKTAQRATADPSTSLAAPDDPTVSREITEEGESARVSHDPKRIELATRTRGPEAQKVFDALTQLRAVFGEGGRTGWRGLGQSIGDFQPLVGKSDEAFEEFLTLLDEETDASFLESLLHHLPLARTEGQAAILEDKDLHAEIWARFENDEADDRRLAFLRFFAFNRKLVTPRMDAFLKIAKNETAGPVRQLGIDAVASNVDVISDTWETLAWVFENDPELSHQQTALHGLAYAESERAASIVVGAFQSADESLRAAAWKSAAGNSPPESVVGSDTDSFLRSELLEAKSSEYKLALIPHMLKHRTEELVPLLERLVESEKDWTVKREYRRAIQSLQQDTAQP